MFKDTRLLEADVLNRNKIDYISRTWEEGGYDILNKAFIGNIKTVARVDMGGNESGNPDSAKHDKNNHKKERARGGIKVENKWTATINEDTCGDQDDRADKSTCPKTERNELGSFNYQHKMLTFFKGDAW